MATANSTRATRGVTTCRQQGEPAADGVLVVDNTNEFLWEASGTREQLLAAGLCTPTHFPLGKKRSSHGMTDGRVWMLKYVRAGLWNLKIWRTEDDRAALCDAARQDTNAKKVPATAEEWRSKAIKDVECSARLMLGLLTEQGTAAQSGFSFTADGMRVIEAQLSRVRMLVRSLPIAFNSAAREVPPQVGADLIPKLRAPLRLAAVRCAS